MPGFECSLIHYSTGISCRRLPKAGSAHSGFNYRVAKERLGVAR